MKPPHLYHFTASEFVRVTDKTTGATRNWYADMSPRLLFGLDLFRVRWSEYKGEDTPVRISPHDDAIGRIQPTHVLSDHNFAGHNEVRGIDVFPRGMDTREDAEAALQIARECGITAIGLYPFWTLGGVVTPGLHFGDRRTSKPLHPATWGGVPDPEGGQMYTTLATALELMPE